MVTRKGYTVHMAAKELGIDHKSLWDWVHKQQDGSMAGDANSLQEENRRLRKENKRLRMERDILKKATAFFAKGHA
jgi:transposase